VSAYTFKPGDEVAVCDEDTNGRLGAVCHFAKIQTVGKRFIRLVDGPPNAWRLDGEKAEPLRFGSRRQHLVPASDATVRPSK
jgi:hypothetical protein